MLWITAGSPHLLQIKPCHFFLTKSSKNVILTGRFKGNSKTTIHVTGKVGDLTQEIAIGVNLDDSAATHQGIACVWARKKIETLANQATHDNNPDQFYEILGPIQNIF